MRKAFLLLACGGLLAAIALWVSLHWDEDRDSLSIPFRSGSFSIVLVKDDVHCYYAVVSQDDGSERRFFLSSKRDYMRLADSRIHLIIVDNQYAIAYMIDDDYTYVFFAFDATSSTAYTRHTSPTDSMINAVDMAIRANGSKIVYTDLSMALCRQYKNCR